MTAATHRSKTSTQSTSHYSTTRRHSLYGIEDRVVIDPGSRIWKVGFSGEGRPRDVFFPQGKNGAPLWTLSRASESAERVEEDTLLALKLEACLRNVFHKLLLTDPRARKVIVVENALLPLHIKDVLARILFENLQILSVSFASSHLLSLLSVGRVTGLVLECGHLESTALPIFASRPLFPQLRTTPLAGSKLTQHLRALILLFGTYLPPPTSLSATANIPVSSRSTRVPQELLTDALTEEIKTRCCFVGAALEAPSVDVGSPAVEADLDLPPHSDTAPSESEVSARDSILSSHRGSSEFSAASPSGERHLQVLASMYTRHSTATDIQMQVDPPLSSQTGTGRGTLIIPGWIRERAAEVLFEGGDVDECSVAEVILDAILKVPLDLRKTMASSILCVGGTPMLPGFIPRLHTELVRTLSAVPSPQRQQTRPGRSPPPPYDRYASLRPLTKYIAILNNPSPPPPNSGAAKVGAGSAPAFAPVMIPWVGGSLAGFLKTGGAEVMREKWDEVHRKRGSDDLMEIVEDAPDRSSFVLPDWTRIPLNMATSPVVARSPRHETTRPTAVNVAT